MTRYYLTTKHGRETLFVQTTPGNIVSDIEYAGPDSNMGTLCCETNALTTRPSFTWSNDMIQLILQCRSDNYLSSNGITKCFSTASQNCSFFPLFSLRSMYSWVLCQWRSLHDKCHIISILQVSMSNIFISGKWMTMYINIAEHTAFLNKCFFVLFCLQLSFRVHWSTMWQR